MRGSTHGDQHRRGRRESRDSRARRVDREWRRGDVAARLQQIARPGEILVGDRSHAASSRVVLYGPRRDVEAKGRARRSPLGRLAPLPPSRPCGDRNALLRSSGAGGAERSRSSRPGASANRSHSSSPSSGRPVSGITSRRRVLARFPRREVQGRCLPYGEGITYWPLAEAASLTPRSSTTTRSTSRSGNSARRPRGRRAGRADVFDAIAWTIGFGSGSPLSSMDSQAVAAPRGRLAALVARSASAG